jgi:hypothetical protein
LLNDANLSKAEAMNKALKAEVNKIQNIMVSVIEAVKYGKELDTWTVYLRDANEANEFNFQLDY